MLKTNSKQARLNVQDYIIKNFCGENYDIETPDTFAETAAVIIDTFRRERPAEDGYSRMTERERFAEWAAGLPLILDTCYYYNRSAVDDLAEILQETDSEKSRYSEEQAENFLTNLIYNELLRSTKC